MSFDKVIKAKLGRLVNYCQLSTWSANFFKLLHFPKICLKSCIK